VIELRGLRLLASVGVLPEEKERRQPIELDLDVVVDVSAAAASDALADAVDYGAVCDAVAAAVGAGHVELLERLAWLVAATVLSVDERIAEVEAVVRKLRPPVPHDLASAGVRVRVER
jgi:dihydroneopterin aldolase